MSEIVTVKIRCHDIEFRQKISMEAANRDAFIEIVKIAAGKAFDALLQGGEFDSLVDVSHKDISEIIKQCRNEL